MLDNITNTQIVSHGVTSVQGLERGTCTELGISESRNEMTNKISVGHTLVYLAGTKMCHSNIRLLMLQRMDARVVLRNRKLAVLICSGSCQKHIINQTMKIFVR